MKPSLGSSEHGDIDVLYRNLNPIFDIDVLYRISNFSDIDVLYRDLVYISYVVPSYGFQLHGH